MHSEPSTAAAKKAEAELPTTELRSRDLPSVKLTPTGENSVALTIQSEPAEVTMAAYGTDSPAFLEGLLRQIVDARPTVNATEIDATFALQAVKGIGPKDAAEAMLAAQMVAVHQATMRAAQRLGATNTVQGLDLHEKTMNKLARTYAAQMEALKRYRSKGEQKVLVQHVNLEAGAQAVVGVVERSGRGD